MIYILYYWALGRPELGVYRANLRNFNKLVPVGERLTRFTMHPLENVSLISWPISFLHNRPRI